MPHRKTRRRIVLYSGGQERRNAQIHDTLLELALRRGRGRANGNGGGESEGVRMTYMPYTLAGSRPFYQRFVRRYLRLAGMTGNPG